MTQSSKFRRRGPSGRGKGRVEQGSRGTGQLGKRWTILGLRVSNQGDRI